MIIRAIPEDHEALTTLTKKSKAFWGYGAELLAQWDTVLTITPDYISENETYKLVEQNTIIGYYSFLVADAQTITLDNLFIDPEFMGKGNGKLLLEDAIDRARGLDFKAIILESDVNAAAFYSRFGFVISGQVETSVAGRFLPLMKLVLP